MARNRFPRELGNPQRHLSLFRRACQSRPAAAQIISCGPQLNKCLSVAGGASIWGLGQGWLKGRPRINESALLYSDKHLLEEHLRLAKERPKK